MFTGFQPASMNDRSSSTTTIDLTILQQTVNALTAAPSPLPPADSVVASLLQAEKAAKRSKTPSRPEGLLGGWRLQFVTGTQRARQRAGIVLGAGRFLPRWVNISLTFTATPLSSERPVPSLANQGTLLNRVEFAGLKLELSGPSRFWSPSILSFDFTQINVNLFGLRLYRGYLWGGEAKEQQFAQQALKEQAFFNFFLIEEQFIAARGRGGGLALWTRQA
uniref:Plastid lipid-associated protein/fibrillin conserved domain-containing protein n=1 Tax=Cyanothece sp. (strain PCC 7425 / ATCC 29141) TaxID=395961 RepID=B8HQ48_CYAP4